MHWDIKSRYIGNILSLVGYFMLVHVDPLIGSVVKIVGLVLVTPFCIRFKLWDVVFLFGVFGLIDLSNIVKLVFT
jgi:Flp pilus assembly protein protease CpaA